MSYDAGHTLTPSAARQVQRAVRFTSRFSREAVNRTAGATESPHLPPGQFLWPVEVTDDDPPTEGEVFGYPQLADLMPGRFWYPEPDVTTDPPTFVWAESPCWVRTIPGKTLAADDSGMAKLVGWVDAVAAYDARPVYAIVPGGGGEPGFFGELTTPNAGKWNFYRLTLSGTTWVRDGAEVTGYPAVPSLIDPTLTCNPMPGMRGWFIPSAGSAGKYEFMLVLSPPLLCEVTVSASAHTVKQKTYSGGITDYGPTTTYTTCRSVTGAAIPVGTLVLMWKIPDVSGEHWIMPVTQPLETYLDFFTDSPHAISGTAWTTLPDITVTVPAGTWEVDYAISGTITGGTSAALDQIEVRLYDATAGAAVAATQYQLTCLPLGMTGVQIGENAGQAACSRKLTVAGSTNFVLQTRFRGGSASGQIDDAMIEAARWHARA